MGLQLYAYDQNGGRHEVQLYEEDPIKLTISAESIDDVTRVDSTFSRTFRIPANQNNSQVFQWWYELNTIDYDITKKVRAEIYVDGLIYKTGFIRINGAFVNDGTDQVDLEVVFYGETSDFATQVGQGHLSELDLSSSNHYYSYENMELTWNAFDGTPYAPGETPGTLNDQKVRYILAQRGYDYNDAGVLLNDAEISIGYADSFDTPGHPLSIFQMTPMIQVKHVIDAIFAETDYTYSADSVFNQDWFRYLYTDGLPSPTSEITQDNNDARWIKTFPQNYAQNRETIITDWTGKVSGLGNTFNLVSGIWTSPTSQTASCDIEFQTDYSGSTFPFTPISVTFRIYVNGVQQAIQTFSGNSAIAGTVLLNLTYAFAPGDKLWITTEWNSTFPLTSAFTYDTFFEVSNTPANIVTANLMRDDIKKIDFLKSILTKFKLLMVPSKYETNQFIVKPFVDYVATGDRFDWTHKLDGNKDVVLRPLFFEQANTIVFTDTNDVDYINAFYQDSYAKVYGRLQFESGNELLTSTQEIKTLFAPTPLDQIFGDGLSQFIIPWFARFGDKTTGTGTQEHLQILPVDTQPRLLFWNGMQSTGGITWYDAVDSHDIYPLMSPYSVWPPNADTLNLNWFREFGFFEPVFDASPGYSVYEAYWNSYIQSLYSPQARLMTAYFNVDAQDLKDLTFDDVIFIKNAWWRPIKIYDAPLTDIATVKVDLIKLLQYPPLEEVPVGGNWGISSEEFPGGGGPGDPVLTTYYYQLLNCTVEEPPIVGAYTGYAPLTLGTIVNVSGNPYVGQCYEVILQSQQQPVTTILDQFTTCEECLG